VDDEVGIGETFATPDTTVAAVLVDRTDLMLMTIEGQAKPLIGAAVDGRGLRQVLELRPDLLLRGICAIDADDGIAAYHSEDAQMKSALLERFGSVAIAVLNESYPRQLLFRSAQLMLSVISLLRKMRQRRSYRTSNHGEYASTGQKL
jgi:DeoR/GlpR family transcriptional regulator of sugar metabolism